MVPLNLPNVLTVVRILLVPVLIVALLEKTSGGDLLAAIVFATASLTDAAPYHSAGVGRQGNGTRDSPNSGQPRRWPDGCNCRILCRILREIERRSFFCRKPDGVGAFDRSFDAKELEKFADFLR